MIKKASKIKEKGAMNFKKRIVINCKITLFSKPELGIKNKKKLI